MPPDTILLVLILFAGFYLAWNIGANDVANAMGTSVGSGALTMTKAVCIAAVLEFSGAFFFGSHVSATIQSGIINAEIFKETPLLLVYGMLSALLATGLWLQIASYFGWPVSTTHGIVGGVVGFGAIVGGFEAVYWDNVGLIVISWILSPLFGGIFSYAIFNVLRKKILYTANPVAEARKLVPLLVFIVSTTLALIMIFSGLQNMHLGYSFPEALGLSMLVGALCAGISYFCVKRVRDIPVPHHEHPYGSEVSTELDKARKHVLQAQSACRGETYYQVSVLLEEINSLSQSLKQTGDKRVMSAEYETVERMFGYLQIMSACLMAFAHGANDVANAIGPLSAAISVLTSGVIVANTTVPAWALGLGGFGIVVGLATWGWRVIETIGKKITELTPTRGFAAEFGAAATILIASRLGMPISTTHTLVGSVIGVGFARGIEALDLTTTRDIFISWIVTVPICALFSVVCFSFLNSIFS
ncbi:MAG: inorganic phosphate transporter [Parachlamydiaceae bacterium]|nr:inorganic phosphate transporter [Parachlamydiaceae bacterium]